MKKICAKIAFGAMILLILSGLVKKGLADMNLAYNIKDTLEETLGEEMSKNVIDLTKDTFEAFKVEFRNIFGNIEWKIADIE